ncbi:MAG: hypothetical protein ACXWCG_08475 [Flavitalea sp.]
MKSRFPPYLLVYFLIVTCNNKKTSNTENSASQTEKTAKNSLVSCYSYASANDTITLKLTQVDESITGTLVYKLYGKDKNIGTIQGRMRGDLFVADYTFMSEGITSTRQIAFKKKQNYFIEGYGDIDSNSDKVSFKNLDSLQFNDSIKLAEIDCQE